MARKVDPGLVKQRRTALDLLAMARLEVSTMAEKSEEIRALTEAQVRGHAGGERVAHQAGRAAELLHTAHQALLSASSAAQDIDVTVEVPDEPRYD
ncbi:hypothetical protein [Granulicoccus sp. GXG6511]|uniref:hypothetical protein n=1 Tax=Granulicoccus sp. GXG6511 TaxID=3381351 RepID=UPI003D7CABEE